MVYADPVVCCISVLVTVCTQTNGLRCDCCGDYVTPCQVCWTAVTLRTAQHGGGDVLAAMASYEHTTSTICSDTPGSAPIEVLFVLGTRPTTKREQQALGSTNTSAVSLL